MSRQETEIIRETKASLKAYMKQYYKGEKVIDINVLLDSRLESITFGTLFTITENHIIMKYDFEYEIDSKEVHVHYLKMMY